MKSWNDRLNTPGINGITPSPRTIGDVVEGQPMLARSMHSSAPSPKAWT
ncbi:hypothetical protein NKJ81_09330 [Mesorhizobium sp. M0018]